jgi:hypothetical protein
MSLRIRLAAALLLASVAACAAPPPPPPSVMIAPDLAMTLPRPAELGHDMRAVQLVTARYGERTVSFEGYIDVTDGHFRMAVVDPLGRKALTVDWTGSAITYDAAPWFPEGLRPQNILADLALIYWPPEVLRRALGPGASLEATPGHRAVLRDGKQLIRADFSPGTPSGERVHYANFAFGYGLDIRTAEPAQ